LKYRSRFDIVGVLLQSSVRGATKTRLMYDAFLSHNQAEEYLSFLLAKELISLAPDKKHYLPTEKGLRFLEMYAGIKDTVAIERDRTLSVSETESPESHDIIEVPKPRPEPAGGAQGPPGLGIARSSPRARPGGND
jgi:predicted transcriptional regulator